jgi:putrescine transport system permease protein
MNRAVFIVPVYAWLLAAIALPFALIVAISFGEATQGAPPFEWRFSLASYRLLLADDLYWGALANAARIAGTSTLMCLLVGYPMALAIARARPPRRALLLFLVMLPFWTSFLIRVYAWMGLLRPTGLVNALLAELGLVDAPLQLLANEFAVHLGIVYAYLPFMVLPLYANLIKHDHRLIEAAYDLGAKPLAAFFKITVPLSFAGIVAGCMLVFIPAVGEFVIPELLGGPSTKMIGKVLWEEYFTANDWPRASAIAIVMLLMLVIPIMIFHRQQSRQLESRLS